jgi:hypothetical protein
MMYLKDKNRLCVGKVYGLDGRRNPKMPAVLALVYVAISSRSNHKLPGLLGLYVLSCSSQNIHIHIHVHVSEAVVQFPSWQGMIAVLCESALVYPVSHTNVCALPCDVPAPVMWLFEMVCVGALQLRSMDSNCSLIIEYLTAHIYIHIYWHLI